MNTGARAAVLEPAAARQQPRGATIWALARLESGRLLRHPAFLLGLAATLGVIVLRSGADPWLSIIAWGFAWIGTLMAGALVAGRQRLLADPDLFPATPATPGDRVVATSLALIGPTLVSATAMVFVAVAVNDGGLMVGENGYIREVTPAVAVWVQPVLLVALAGVVGIVVAQLGRGRLAVLVLLVFLMFVGGAGIWVAQQHPFRVLHPFMYPSYEHELPASFSPEGWSPGDAPLHPPDQYNRTWREVRFDTTALHWHLLYVAGLILLGIWWARRTADRGDPDSARWMVLAAVPLLVVGGVAQILTAGVNP